MHATVGLLKSVASLLYLVCPIHVDVHLYLMVYHFILFYLYCRYDVAPAHPTLRLAANLANPFGAVPAYPFGAVPTAVSANPLAVVSSSSENSSTETTLEVSAEPRHSRHSNLSLLSSLFSLLRALSLARALSRLSPISSSLLSRSLVITVHCNLAFSYCLHVVHHLVSVIPLGHSLIPSQCNA